MLPPKLNMATQYNLDCYKEGQLKPTEHKSPKVIITTTKPPTFDQVISGITSQEGAKALAEKYGAPVVYFDKRRERAYLVKAER